MSRTHHWILSSHLENDLFSTVIISGALFSVDHFDCNASKLDWTAKCLYSIVIGFGGSITNCGLIFQTTNSPDTITTPLPLIIDMGGLGTGAPLERGPLMSSHGFAVFAFDYFSSLMDGFEAVQHGGNTYFDSKLFHVSGSIWNLHFATLYWTCFLIPKFVVFCLLRLLPPMLKTPSADWLWLDPNEYRWNL